MWATTIPSKKFSRMNYVELSGQKYFNVLISIFQHLEMVNSRQNQETKTELIRKFLFLKQLFIG